MTPVLFLSFLQLARGAPQWHPATEDEYHVRSVLPLHVWVFRRKRVCLSQADSRILFIFYIFFRISTLSVSGNSESRNRHHKPWCSILAQTFKQKTSQTPLQASPEEVNLRRRKSSTLEQTSCCWVLQQVLENTYEGKGTMVFSLLSSANLQKKCFFSVFALLDCTIGHYTSWDHQVLLI